MPLREYVERKEFQAEVVISNVEAAETRVYNWRSGSLKNLKKIFARYVHQTIVSSSSISTRLN